MGLQYLKFVPSSSFTHGAYWERNATSGRGYLYTYEFLLTSLHGLDTWPGAKSRARVPLLKA